MDELNVSSPTYSQPGSPSISQPRTPAPSSSGITLVLPSLKALKSSKDGKNAGKQRSGSHVSGGYLDSELLEKKPPRPVKLKPLKEVLTKLITQIKRKDDYAFFLRPVDPTQVSGYADVIQRPMDFGTMKVKVEKGRYRSLDDFSSDLKLVTSNAKTFNPQGSIYYTEADRIEAWALDHIAKAAPTVIQFEADWNIDIEKDDESNLVDIDNDDDVSMDVESVHDGRSASVVSQQISGPSRRGPRGPYKKGPNTGVAESIEADFRLPGAKDGLGSFPPRSDWARTMLQLKLKGKRYRTKKERLRVEKEGPPLLPEGSLDYTEMEDPFSVLSFFVPDPFVRPYLTPLYPPLSSTTQSQPLGRSTPISQPPRATFPTATAAPLTYTFSLSQSASTPASTLKRRFWTLTRNPVSRAKGKEKDEDGESSEVPAWQTPREAHATDFGSFAVLAGELAQEMRRRGVPALQGPGVDDDQNTMLDMIRNSFDGEIAANANGSPVDSTLGYEGSNGGLFSAKDYWSLKRAAEAEEHLRDVVYGGVDGLAYVRSLAEFVTTYQSEYSSINYRSPTVFGMPLAQWVEREIVLPLTDGRHALLQQTAEQLRHLSSKVPPGSMPTNSSHVSPSVAKQVYLSVNVYPSAMVALSALLQIKTHKIDMGALIKVPEELFHSEKEWAGKVFKERRKQTKMPKTESHPEAMEVEESPTDSPDQTDVDFKSHDVEVESPEELKEVLDYVADAIVSHDQVVRKRMISSANPNENAVTKAEDEAEEDHALRNIRLNLLALAKRAPLDTLARLPKDLVPEHIRRYVPTLGGS
ncbi:hypothetical protein APHAL10511_005807 [Amanita phalloides]|nr:hypothetical protein APHAL10511_005807 [Amanita phalloides]